MKLNKIVLILLLIFGFAFVGGGVALSILPNFFAGEDLPTQSEDAKTLKITNGQENSGFDLYLYVDGTKKSTLYAGIVGTANKSYSFSFESSQHITIKQFAPLRFLHIEFFNSGGTKIYDKYFWEEVSFDWEDLDGVAQIEATSSYYIYSNNVSIPITVSANGGSFTTILSNGYANSAYQETTPSDGEYPREPIICSLGERNYSAVDGKTGAVKYLGWYTRGIGWSGPLIVSTNSKAVGFEVSGDTSAVFTEPGGSFLYKGVTYYYNSGNHAMPGVYSTLNDTLLIDKNEYRTHIYGYNMEDCARKLLDSASGTLNIHRGYDAAYGHINVGFGDWEIDYMHNRHPRREGYTFKGYYTEKTGGTAVTKGATIVNIPHTIYAQWQGKTYSVYFYSNGNRETKSSTVTFGSAYGSALPTVAENVPEGAGTFAGWWTKDGTSNGDWGTQVTSSTVVSIADMHRLYARFYRSITFNAGDGTLSDGTKTSVVTCLQSTYPSTFPTVVVPTGYTFDGWYHKNALSFVMKATAGATGLDSTYGGFSSLATTLYAKYKANEYSVTFYNGDASVGTKTVTYGSKYGSLISITKTGYSLTWWTKDGRSNGDWGKLITTLSNVETAANHNLYAKWIAGQVLVNFVSMGVPIHSGSVSYDSTYAGAMPSNPIKSGFEFEGWWTKDGKKTGDWGSQVLPTTKVTTTTNHNVYARWKRVFVKELKYDTTDKYWYFEYGEKPGRIISKIIQTDEINPAYYWAWMNSRGENINVPVYRCDGALYAVYNNQTFLIEPIRWRVSEYGASNVEPTTWKYYTPIRTDFEEYVDGV